MEGEGGEWRGREGEGGEGGGGRGGRGREGNGGEGRGKCYLVCTWHVYVHSVCMCVYNFVHAFYAHRYEETSNKS